MSQKLCGWGSEKCSLQVQVPEASSIKIVEDLAGKHVVPSFEVLSGEYFGKLDEKSNLSGDQNCHALYTLSPLTQTALRICPPPLPSTHSPHEPSPDRITRIITTSPRTTCSAAATAALQQGLAIDLDFDEEGAASSAIKAQHSVSQPGPRLARLTPRSPALGPATLPVAPPACRPDSCSPPRYEPQRRVRHSALAARLLAAALLDARSREADRLGALQCALAWPEVWCTLQRAPRPFYSRISPASRHQTFPAPVINSY
ncbi:hypothetical protein K438DRAFT_1750441 [Mycena galopus ATCC 62051]|nr:hypothetical protein K438DRAFT_1750441 [Mycena galopus ATCC 62051]